ncbi:MAG: ABC transporter permease [Clostridia bacterium]|nr:ABC transporter permease [Clostridia bacterium]
MKQRFSSVFRTVVGYRSFGLIIALAVLLIVAAILTPDFYSLSSISSMLTNNATTAILAVGMMFVLLTGGIDISVGAILAVSGISVTKLMIAFPSVPAFVWVITAVVIGTLCGTVNGFLIGRLKIVPLIVTLGTMYVFRGAAYVISGGEWIFTHKYTDSFLAVSQTDILGFDSIVLWTVILFAAAAYFLRLTKPGRRLYAVGTSYESSEIAGIDAAKVRMFAYILCGGCAGLAGVLYSANYAMVNSDIGAGFEMTAIAVCVLGGVSIVGGLGRIDGVFIAAILMSVLTYLLSLLPGFSVWKDALQGGIILVAVAVNIINGNLTKRRELKERGRLI